MRAQGFRSCVLEVLSSNARAIRFYEAHGFEKICSFRVEENGMNLSCDLMQKAQLQLISPKSV
ncbi:GNAT family N-acetyltransferase [Hungatella effluvii]|uniref:GNAT family N-acetyltransferase n=1 Tax=Hungatella effluvii TaxID=1096246 RepID=UPI0032E3F2FD